MHLCHATQCFVAEDRDRLLGTVEVGFNSLESFNRAVIEMLRQAAPEAPAAAAMPGDASEGEVARATVAMLRQIAGDVSALRSSVDGLSARIGRLEARLAEAAG